MAKNPHSTEIYVEMADYNRYEQLCESIVGSGDDVAPGQSRLSTNFRYIRELDRWVLVDKKQALNETVLMHIEDLLACNGISVSGDRVLNMGIVKSTTNDIFAIKINKYEDFDTFWLLIYNRKPITVDLATLNDNIEDCIVIYKDAVTNDLQLLVSHSSQNNIEIDVFYHDVKRYMNMQMKYSPLRLKDLMELDATCKVHSAMRFDLTNLEFNQIKAIRLGGDDVLSWETSRNANDLMVELVKLYFKQDF